MNIEEIREFTKNKNAWYHMTVPDGATNDEIMSMKNILDDSQIEGTILITRQRTHIRDITEYMQKHRLKDIE